MMGAIPQPSGWQALTVADLVSAGADAIVGGPFGSSLTSADYVPDGVPVIRGSNLAGEECRFVDEDFVYVSPEKAEELRRNTAAPGDVIFTQRGTLGQVAIIPTSARFQTYIVSQSQMRVRVDESRVLPRFLYWFYRSPFSRRYLESRTLATGVPHINLGILRDFPVALPALSEQRRIAAILDEADDLRRKRREALGLLDDLLRSAFLEMFGDPVTNPRGWPVVALADVTDGFRNGLSPSTTGEVEGRVLTLGAVTGAYFDASKCKSAVFDRVPDDSQLATDGTFLICRGNGNLDLVGQGKVAWGAPANTAFPDTIIACRPRTSVLREGYLSEVWRSGVVREQIVAGARTTNGTFKVNQQVLAGVRFPLPPITAQHEFATVAGGIAKQRRLADEAVAQSTRLFDSLLASAFAGGL